MEDIWLDLRKMESDTSMKKIINLINGKYILQDA